MTKDNIMKITDGLFHRVFDEVATRVPRHRQPITRSSTSARRGWPRSPRRFDVIVTLNLYGDILSDIAAQVAGSVGLAGSANIGATAAMFEAVHGSAPDIAGNGVANPSGLLQAAVQMLVHLDQAERAERIANAWLCTLESGLHTADIFRDGLSRDGSARRPSPTAVIERLGSGPRLLAAVRFRPGASPWRPRQTPASEKALVGVDVFLDWNEADRDPNRLGRLVEAAAPPSWRLKMMTNRGVKVYPDGIPETYCTDHWRARCVPRDAGAAVSFDQVLPLLAAMHGHGLHVIKTEHLYTIDGRAAYSLGQGE